MSIAIKDIDQAVWERNTTHILPGLCKSRKQNFLNQQKHQMTIKVRTVTEGFAIIGDFEHLSFLSDMQDHSGRGNIVIPVYAKKYDAVQALKDIKRFEPTFLTKSLRIVKAEFFEPTKTPNDNQTKKQGNTIPRRR